MPHLLLLMATLSSPQAQDARGVMVGNSYTAQNNLHDGVAKALEGTVPGWSEVLVHPLTQGGATLDQHAAQADGTNGDTPWRDALVTGPNAGSWDWVVLQDQSQVPGLPQSHSQWQASRDGAIILDEIIAAGGAETLFLLTWGRRDGDSGNPDRYPDFLTMQEHLTEGYLAYAEACATDGEAPWVIPAGHAWRTIHQDLTDTGVDPTDGDTTFTALYDGDGSHPSSAGSYLAALTAAAALTGRSVSGVATAEGLDETLAATLRDAATRTVLDDPFGEIPYRWAFTWDAWLDASGDDPSTGIEVSGDTIRPVLLLTHPADPVTSLDISDGRLWIQDGASLEADTVQSCSDGCAIVISGGTLVLGSGNLGGLQHHGGVLSIEGNVGIPGDYTLPGDANLDLTVADPSQPSLRCDGDVWLEGSLAVAFAEDIDTSQGIFTLVEADSITLDLTEQQLPEGSTIEVQNNGVSQTLVLLLDGASTDDTDSTPGGDEGCGCSTRPTRGWPQLLLALLLPVWLRRSHHTAQPQRTAQRVQTT